MLPSFPFASSSVERSRDAPVEMASRLDFSASLEVGSKRTVWGAEA